MPRKTKEEVEIVFTPWPYDADRNDLNRVVLTGQDAKTLSSFVLDMTVGLGKDLTAAEGTALAALTEALRKVGWEDEDAALGLRHVR